MRMCHSSFAVCLALAAVAVACITATPLEDYVNAPDPTYSYSVPSSVKMDGGTLYNILLVSQTWNPNNESSMPVWTHWLQVCIPDLPDPTSDIAFMYIDGGSNSTNAPKGASNGLTLQMCVSTATVTADLGQIPSQPITFSGDPVHKSRSEDALIAYTWRKFIDNPTSKEPWPARYPMTKASVKAMDAIQDFVSKQKGINPIKRFIVGGASKRGWTTWMVGAVDPRVVAIVPIVAPVGHLVQMLNEMWQAYGAWTFAFKDYLAENIIGDVNKPIFQELLNIVGPLAYQKTLNKLPKYVLCATGDEFFMPDATRWFWDQLEGPKWMRMVPNAEHSMAGHAEDLTANVQEFYLSVKNNKPRPVVSWTIDDQTGKIVMTSDTKPNQAVVWNANNPRGRDFRLIVCGDPKNVSCLNPIFWFPKDIQATSSTNGTYTYEADFPAPSEGYTGFIIELTFNIGGLSGIDPWKISTTTSIVPRSYPFPPCNSECGGPEPSPYPPPPAIRRGAVNKYRTPVRTVVQK